jgi:ribose transport system substrate-binding protein
MRKMLMVVVVAVLVAAAAFSMAPAQAQAKKFRIGVSNSFVGSEWRSQMLQDMEDAVKDLKAKNIADIELVIESKDTDVAGQIQQIQNLLNKKVQAIIVNPGDVKGLNATIEDAVAGGVPVISVDQAIDAKGVVNVVIDQKEWAKISAKWLAEKLGGKGDIVLIEGFVGHPANEARMAGVKEVLDTYKDIKVVGRDTGKWDQATGQQVMSKFLTSLPKIDGVWTQDGMATGVLTALKSAANLPKWPIVSGEARASYLQLWNEVRATRKDFTSFGVVNPPGVGASGLRVAVELLLGTKIDPAALQGTAKNTLFVPIPFIVDESNFEAQYNAIKSLPASYTLDGSITQDEAKQLMAGKFKIEAPKAIKPGAMMGATPAATRAATPAR